MSSKQKTIIVQKLLNDIIKSLDQQGGYIINVYFNSIDKELQSNILETPEGWQFFVGTIKPFAGGDTGQQVVGCECVVYFFSEVQEHPVELLTIQSINTFDQDDPSTSSARLSCNLAIDLVVDGDMPKLKMYARKYFDKVARLVKETWNSQVIEMLQKSVQPDVEEEQVRQKPVPVSRGNVKTTADAIDAMPSPSIDEMGADDDFPESQVPTLTRGSTQQRAQQRATTQVSPPPSKEKKQEKPASQSKKPKEVDEDDGDDFKIDIPRIPRVNSAIEKDLPTLKGNALRTK